MLTADQQVVRDGSETRQVRRASLWTVPNGLTFFRILLIAPFLYFIKIGGFAVALAIFFLASVTDFFDGYLARKLKQQSKLGQLLDPLADKVLTTSAFLVLALPNPRFPSLPVWLAVVVISRDVLILAGSVAVYAITKYSGFKPTFAGRVNTLFEMGLIVWFLFFHTAGVLTSLLPSLYLIVAGSVIVSGLLYVLEGARILRARGSHGT